MLPQRLIVVYNSAAPLGGWGALLFVFSLLFSCASNPPVQTPGERYLQGIWQQDSVPGQQKLITYALYRFKFTCDSFYLQQQTYSRINYGADTCMARGHWTEYMKGNYEQRHDTLRLNGFFCDAHYKIKHTSACFRIGDYTENFKVSRPQDSLLQLLSTNDVVPVRLHLVKELDCHPQIVN